MLTKEHILPRGLHGNLVLPEASCNSCSVITSEMERRVLQGFFERGRRAMGMTSRHKKRKKPPSLPTTFIDQDNARWVENVPIEDGFHVIHLPILIKPLSLGGVSKDGSQSGVEIIGIASIHLGDEKDIKKRGAVGVQINTEIDVWAFARMLGKIAHCYYIAERGWFPLRESPVLPIVMGKSDQAKPWIGCLDDAPLSKPGSNALHLMDITDLTGDDGSMCSVVRVKLFSTTSGPTYAVVVRWQSQAKG